MYDGQIFDTFEVSIFEGEKFMKMTFIDDR